MCYTGYFVVRVRYLHGVISHEKLSRYASNHFVEEDHYLWSLSNLQHNISLQLSLQF